MNFRKTLHFKSHVKHTFYLIFFQVPFAKLPALLLRKPVLSVTAHVDTRARSRAKTTRCCYYIKIITYINLWKPYSLLAQKAKTYTWNFKGEKKSLPIHKHITSSPTSIFLLVQNEFSSSGLARKCFPAPFSFPSPAPPLSANRSWSSASRGSVSL